jgi:hypothetical protein
MRVHILPIAAAVFLWTAFVLPAQSRAQDGKTRIAIIGLDHDHVWRLLHDIAGEPQADLVAIAEPNPALTSKAKSQVSAGVQFYSD